MSLPTGTPGEGRATAPQAPQQTSSRRAPYKTVSRSAASSPGKRLGWTPAKAVPAADTAYNNPAVPGESERGPGGEPAHAAGLMRAA
jgi:hypothetical protein